MTFAARVLAGIGVIALAGCSSDSATSAASRTGSFTVVRGTRFKITMQTIGPGEYLSPPSISSGAVTFLDVSPGAVNVPAGVTQDYHFDATTAGQAIIVFAHSASNPAVTDTIIVK